MTKLRVGIVGAVARGASYIPLFQRHPSAVVTALCDVNTTRLREVGGHWGIKGLYSDYAEMLDAEDLDAVVVATPMPLHVPQSVEALRRGIHVLCEVPAAVSIEEAQTLVQTCKQSTASYMMAENYCFTRENMLVKAIAHAGLFGELYFAEGEYVHELKALNEATPWRRRWQTGINGNTYPTHSLGPILQWMQERVVSVCCVGTGHHYRDPRGAYYENEDSTFTLCRMERGGLVKLRLDMLSNRPHNLAYYSLQGTQGCYEAPRGFGDRHKIWLASRHERMEWRSLADLESEFLPDVWRKPPRGLLESGHGGGDYLVVDEFVSAVLEGRKPTIGVHQAMDMTLPGLVSQQSIAQGSVWLDVPDSRTW
ncbi:MAG: Gfo/Idh/MocA family protein [Armatimonadota bacterium]